VRTDTKEEPKVNAKGSNIGASFAGHPEDAKVAVIIELEELGVVNSPYTELSLDSRYEGRSLEECTGQGIKGARKVLRMIESGV
jgi:uncharacterized protein YvpB